MIEPTHRQEPERGRTVLLASIAIAAVLAQAPPVAADSGDDSASLEAKLRNDSRLDGVTATCERIVTLTGTVDSEADRMRAEQLAREWGGPRMKVDNRIEVARGRRQGTSQGRRRNNKKATMAEVLMSKYRKDALLAGSSIHVEPEDNGGVKLSGTVPSELARMKALVIARGTKGVREVVDELRVVVPQ